MHLVAVDVSFPRELTRAAAVPARLLLAGIVAISFGLRFAAALVHTTPLYFPDEYIYGTIARSLAESGRPLIRGHSAHFPALLEPLLAAPFWLTHDPAVAYRLTQAENALAMSLAAIPVYLLVRRLGGGAWMALAAGALTVASPDLFFASFVLADAIAYPLVLGAIYLGVCALSQPTRLEVFRLLIENEPEGLAAGEVARRMAVPHNTMSTHLAILTRAGLITAERQSRSIVYRARLDAVRELAGYLVQDCCGGRPEICAPLIADLTPCCPPKIVAKETICG